MRLDLVFLVGRSTFGGVFWGVCGRIMILGSLCANGWVCFPVLLVVWHRVSSTVACWSLSGAGFWHLDGDLWEIFSVWYYVGLGGLLWTSVLNLALPPQWHSPDASLEHQEPVQSTWRIPRNRWGSKGPCLYQALVWGRLQVSSGGCFWYPADWKVGSKPPGEHPEKQGSVLFKKKPSWMSNPQPLLRRWGADRECLSPADMTTCRHLWCFLRWSQRKETQILILTWC